MQPKRQVPLWVVLTGIGTIIGTLILNIAAARIDDELVEQFGRGYPMQFALAAVGAQYTPHAISALAMAGLLGLWLWSLRAPPPPWAVLRGTSEGDVERPSDPLAWDDATPPEVMAFGIRWKFVRGRNPYNRGMIAYCPRPEHSAMRLVRQYNNGGRLRLTHISDGRPSQQHARYDWTPWCADEGEEHAVPLEIGGGQDFWDAKLIAQQRYEANLDVQRPLL